LRLRHILLQDVKVARSGFVLIIFHLHGLLDCLHNAVEVIFSQHFDKLAVFAAFVNFKIDALPVK
jgi:hypothetical protein